MEHNQHHDGFQSFNVAVLTVSDRCSRGEAEDESGKLIVEIIGGIKGATVQHDIVPDEMGLVKERLINYCDNLKVDLVLTTGGTGLGARDITPEATRDVSDKIIPGISEIIRIEGSKKTRNSILSRGISSIRGGSIIINLPGSPKGVKESLDTVLNVIPHALEMVKGKGH